jgi:hypothetical protein
MTELYDKFWNKQYEKLVAFKRKHGNCLVPSRYQEDLSLGAWVDTQRRFHSKNIMRQDRKGLLDEIGFVWRVANSAQWNKQYEKLVEFKRKHGNCLVPRGYQEDMSLGMWVSRQRHFHNKNTIQLDRKDLLDKLGFVWRVDNSALRNIQVFDSKWRQQYEKLVEYKRKNGHCQVPQLYKADASFGMWVHSQRRYHIKIRPDRKGLLEELGFAWKAGTAAARSSTTSGAVIFQDWAHKIPKSLRLAVTPRNQFSEI